MKRDADQIVEQIERLRGGELSPEERAEIDLWEKGRALAQISGFYGWEVALATLHSYAEDATSQLLSTNPGDRELVAARHANAYAAERIYHLFIEDVRNAIEHSRTTPSAIASGYQSIKDIPAEAI